MDVTADVITQMQTAAHSLRWGLLDVQWCLGPQHGVPHLERLQNAATRELGSYLTPGQHVTLFSLLHAATPTERKVGESREPGGVEEGATGAIVSPCDPAAGIRNAANSSPEDHVDNHSYVKLLVRAPNGRVKALRIRVHDVMTTPQQSRGLPCMAAAALIRQVEDGIVGARGATSGWTSSTASASTQDACLALALEYQVRVALQTACARLLMFWLPPGAVQIDVVGGGSRWRGW